MAGNKEHHPTKPRANLLNLQVLISLRTNRNENRIENGEDLNDGATGDANGRPGPWNVLVEEIEPRPSLIGGHEHCNVDDFASISEIQCLPSPYIDWTRDRRLRF